MEINNQYYLQGGQRLGRALRNCVFGAEIFVRSQVETKAEAKRDFSDRIFFAGYFRLIRVIHFPASMGQIQPLDRHSIKLRAECLSAGLENNPDNMIRWLQNLQAVDEKTAIPNPSLNEQTARDFVAYLYTLKR